MPKRSAFELLLADAVGAIDAATSTGKGQHLRRRPLLREFLEWVVLRTEAPEVVALKHGFKGRISAMELRRNSVACAIHLRSRRRVSLGRAAKLAEVTKGDVIATTNLAKLAGVALADLDRNVDEGVPTAVDAHFELLEVSLDQRAVEDLLLAALEAYLVPKAGKGQKYTEIYGYCFGTRRDLLSDGADGRARRIFNVTRVITQLRSHADAGSVTPNTKSEGVHLDVAREFFEHLALVGDYHTHPYGDLGALKAIKGWQPSKADRSHIGIWTSKVRERGGAPRFSLIAAVARGGKGGRAGGRAVSRETPNRIRFCVQGVFVVLAAYRIKRDGTYDEKLRLIVSGVG